MAKKRVCKARRKVKTVKVARPTRFLVKEVKVKRLGQDLVEIYAVTN